jgi:hypothetical protein
MPKGCKWHYVGDYFIDGDHCSDSWSMDVSRDAAGRFFVRCVGDETQVECIGTAELLVGFCDDYGRQYLSNLRDTACGLKGFLHVVQMSDFRLGNRSAISVIKK